VNEGKVWVCHDVNVGICHRMSDIIEELIVLSDPLFKLLSAVHISFALSTDIVCEQPHCQNLPGRVKVLVVISF